MARRPDRPIRTLLPAWFSAFFAPDPDRKNEGAVSVERHEAESIAGEEEGSSTREDSGEFSGWDTMIMALMA